MKLEKIIICTSDRFRKSQFEINEIPTEVVKIPIEVYKGALYITDKYEIYSFLVKHQVCVLPILTEENKGCDFSQCSYMIEGLEGIDFNFCNRVWQRYFKLPWIIIETDDYIVRETVARDIEAVWELYQDSEIKKYIQMQKTKEEEQEYLVNYYNNVYAYYEMGIWSVIDKKTNALIGRMGVEQRIGGVPELGFCIGDNYRRKKVTTKICKEIFAYLEENELCEYLQVYVEKDNEKSHALCTKLGFVRMDTKEKNGKECYYYLKQI